MWTRLFVTALCVVVWNTAEVGAEEVFALIKKGGYLIVVEKERHTLTVYDHTLRAVSTHRVTTGKIKGDKEREGDFKTPEGIYFFTRYIDGRGLPAEYGVGALVMDYPNPFDRLKGKGGYGIWLHATDRPERILRPRDTRGCVVTTDEDFLHIKGFVTYGRTPIVVVKEAELKDGTPLVRELEKEGFIDKERLKGFVSIRDMAVAEDGRTRLYLLADKGWRMVKREPINTRGED